MKDLEGVVMIIGEGNNGHDDNNDDDGNYYYSYDGYCSVVVRYPFCSNTISFMVPGYVKITYAKTMDVGQLLLLYYVYHYYYSTTTTMDITTTITPLIQSLPPHNRNTINLFLV